MELFVIILITLSMAFLILIIALIVSSNSIHPYGRIKKKDIDKYYDINKRKWK